MGSSAPTRPSKDPGQRFDFACPQCGESAQTSRLGEPFTCARCKSRIGPVVQLDQLLARWYEPRRWRADLVKPSVPYLLERLWTANGQGERLYQGVSPHHANYDIFRHLITRLIMQGVEEGWAEITFPRDPLVEDPQYQMRIVDADRFARGVERLFPEVNWDEPVPAALLGEAPKPRAKPSKKSKR